MAEILIQRKRQRAVWPWLLGLAALALLSLPFLGADRGGRTAARPATARRDTTMLRGATAQAAATAPAESSAVAPRTTATSSGAVESTTLSVPAGATAPASKPGTFGQSVPAGTTNTSELEYRENTAGGLRRLADELRTLGASDAGVRTIRAYADSVQTTATAGRRHPDHARAAFLAAVRELDVLRTRHAAAVDTGRLRTAAWAIRPDQPLVAQRRTVQTFFDSARDATQSVGRIKSVRRAR